MDRDQAIKLMQDLLRRMVDKKGSDLFITAGFPPAIKIDGEVRPQSERALTSEQTAVLVRAIMNDRQTKNSTRPRNATSRSRRRASAGFASTRSCSRAAPAASSV